jgi:antitoxin (DNA-binding transcriptional repressor) of toxin-antitoxin stability system
VPIVLPVTYINASEFKAKCLSILAHLESDGVVTKHGKPVAKLIPLQSSCADLIGSFKGKIRIKGSLLSTGRKWDAEF